MCYQGNSLVSNQLNMCLPCQTRWPITPSANLLCIGSAKFLQPFFPQFTIALFLLFQLVSVHFSFFFSLCSAITLSNLVGLCVCVGVIFISFVCLAKQMANTVDLLSSEKVGLFSSKHLHLKSSYTCLYSRHFLNGLFFTPSIFCSRYPVFCKTLHPIYRVK